MATRSSRWLLCGAALCFLLPLVSASFAVPKPEENKESAAEKCRKALEQVHSVDFQNITLAAAIEALRDQTKLNFVLDRATIQFMDMSPDETPVSLKLSQVKLRTILKSLLSQYKLTHVIDQEIVLITSEPYAIERQMQQRVSLDVEQVPLEKALKQLAKETGTNLVADPRHAAKAKELVTLKLDDVPLETAVRLLAEMAGLCSVRQSNVLFVTSKEVAVELRKEEEAAVARDPAAALERLLNGGVIGR
jgi:type II secretory pathway component HofQ